MQWRLYIFTLCLLAWGAGFAFAAPTLMKGEAESSVQIQKDSYGLTSFYCNAKLYRSDIPLKNFQGCQTEDISFGSVGEKARLITVFYDWEDLPASAPKQAKKATFIEKPDGELYRLKHTDFLTNIKLQRYFEDAYGRGQGQMGETNILLSDFSKRNIQSYGNTFCVAHYMKYPFSGVMGWCQNDQLVGGDVGYLNGVLNYSQAAILARGYVYEHGLKLRGGKFFHPETKTVLKTDNDGRMYWGFATPAQHAGRLAYYGFRVYFDETVTVREFSQIPHLGDL